MENRLTDSFIRANFAQLALGGRKERRMNTILSFQLHAGLFGRLARWLLSCQVLHGGAL